MAVDLEHRTDVAAERHVVGLQLEAAEQAFADSQNRHDDIALGRSSECQAKQPFVPGGVPDIVSLVLGQVVELLRLPHPDLGLLVLGDLLLVKHLPHVLLHRLVREVERPLVVLRVHLQASA